MICGGEDDAFEEAFLPSVVASVPPRIPASATSAKSNTRNIVVLLKRRRPRVGMVSEAPVLRLGSKCLSSGLNGVWLEKEESTRDVEGFGVGDGWSWI